MNNQEQWKPTKFIKKNGKYIPSQNRKIVGISSRLIAAITVQHYAEFLPKYAHGKLADLGCGMAPFYLIYKDLVTDTVCTDWGNTSHKNKFLDKECDLNQPLPFPDNEFDTIILSDVLEHIKKPELLWKEMHRVLKKDGCLFLNVPFYYWLHEAPHDYYRYTKFALQSFANESGFKTHILKEIGGAPEIIIDIISKQVYCHLPKIGGFLAAIFQKLGALWLKIKLFQKISRKSARTFPLGYFMVVQKK